MAAPLVLERPIKHWTAEEVDRLVAIGGLPNPERYELLYGQLVEKMSHSQPHNSSVLLALDALRTAFGSGSVVGANLSLKGLSDSEPEPDIMVLRGSANDYRGRNPRAEEVALVVEVSVTTLPKDERDKAPLYARFGVAEYWIIAVPERRLKVHRGPEGDQWRETRIYDENESIPVGAGQVAVADLLPL